MSNRQRSAVVASILLLAVSVTSASEYYVARNGYDGGTGGGNDPWRHIYYGVAQLEAGDTLFIKEGDYLGSEGEYQIWPEEVNGTNTAPITVRAYQSDVVRIIDDEREPNLAGARECFRFINCSYWNIEGLYIKAYKRAIAFDGGAHHNVTNCVFVSNGGPCYGSAVRSLDSNDLTVSGCVFLDPNDANDSYCDETQGHHPSIQDYGVNCFGSTGVNVSGCYFWGRHNAGVSFKDGVDDGTVENCIFEGAYGTAITMGQTSGGPYDQCSNLVAFQNIIRPATNYIVHRGIVIDDVDDANCVSNYVEGSTGQYGMGILVTAEARGAIDIHRNVLPHHARPAVALYAPGDPNATVTVYHNTFYDCDYASAASDIMTSDLSRYDIKNNLSWECHTYAALDPNDGNLQDVDPNFAGPLTQPDLSTEPTSWVFAELYSDLVSRFELTPGSAAIDFGVVIPGWGYYGDAPDAGALEWEP